MPNKFQLLCSYLYEVVLEKTSSAYNPYLEVVLSQGRLRLNTQNITYSYEDLYANFYTVFQQLDVQKMQLNHVLILGFGLGSIPFMLQRHFEQYNAQYTGVEIDEVIIQLAKKYLPPDVLQNVTLHNADAYQWVQNAQTPAQGYDLLAIDLFIDQDTPPIFYSPAFLQASKALLNRNKGILVYNMLADTPDKKQSAQDFYHSAFKATFDNAFCINTTANLMLVQQNNT
jgi:spermidine synthase